MSRKRESNKKTGAPVLSCLNLNAAGVDIGATEIYIAVSVDPLGDTPDEFAARIAADLDLWAQAVVAAGIKRQPTQP